MQAAPSSASLAVRRGFWAAVVLGALALVSSVVDPAAALITAAPFFAFAWGIRRGHAWAAIAATVHLLAPLFRLARANPGAIIPIALVLGAVAYLLVRAAVELWRDPHPRRLCPWAPAAVLTAVFWLTCQPFAISAGSMANTLQQGDKVLVESASWMLGRTPHLGDVVVLRYPPDPKQLFVKRVVAGPGDRVRIQNKELVRNGELIAEPYALHESRGVEPFRDNFPDTPTVRLASEGDEMLRYHVQGGEVLVPDGKYFVLGDNRENSLDSRYWGFIGAHEIVGSPVIIYSSHEPRNRGLAPIRWGRLLKLVQ